MGLPGSGFSCESELKHAEPVKGHNLLAFSLIIRHGQRSPMTTLLPNDKAGFWTCEDNNAYAPRMSASTSNGHTRRYFSVYNDNSLYFPPSCGRGELTVVGARQHAELGEFYRDFLINQQKFLPSKLNKSLIKVRSTKVDRVIRSTTSFMSTFYPPEAPGEHMDIVTGTYDHEPMYPDYGQCKYINEQWQKFIKTPEFLEKKATSEILYQPIWNKYNVTKDETTWMFFGDWMTSYYCADHDLIPEITEQIFQQGVEDIAYYSYGFFNYTHGAVAGAILRQVLGDLQLAADKKDDARFFFYGAHDSTIAAIEEAIGFTNFKDNVLPPYRSHLAIELWEAKGEKKVRFVLNGTPLVFPNGNELMSLKELLQNLTEVMSYCSEEFPY